MMHTLSQISLDLPNLNKMGETAFTVIAGDVGGTKTNLAFYKFGNDSLKLLVEESFHSSDYSSFIDIIKLFIAKQKLALPDRICAGVAGPIIKGRVVITNLPWTIEVENIRAETGVHKVQLLNDLEATAFGLAGLEQSDFINLHEGDTAMRGNAAIIAPGTGLGEAGLYWDGNSFHPFATEGGHCDFCPRNDLDIQLLKFLQKKYGVVSWEKVVAGPGIHDIYLFLRTIRNLEEPSWLSEALAKNDPSAVISHAAVENRDVICQETLQLFVGYLARASANLVLKMKATGGLFLGGGIPPKISTLLKGENFYKNYLECDRMQQLLEQAPIRLINNDRAALIGAAWYGAFGVM